MPKFEQMSTKQKQQFAKKFTLRERECYRKGKRNGWLNHYHATKDCYKKTVSVESFPQRKYTQAEFDALFTKFDK